MARAYRRKRSYSTRQRILVHLSSTLGGYEPDILVFLTQEGIGAAIRSGRSTATKWLMRLGAEGLLLGQREHVPGHRTRKTVYRLTKKGWDAARPVLRRLTTDIVDVTGAGPGSISMRVAEVPRFFPGVVNLTSTVSLVREGRIDLAALTDSQTTIAPFVLWGETLRRTERFFGRKAEMRSLDAWVASPSPVLVVTGLPGIGKSSLVAAWVLRHRPRTHVLWSEVSEGTTLATFLTEFAEFLARVGRRGLSTMFLESEPLDTEVLTRLLAHELKDLSVLVVLDNVQKCPPEILRFLTDPHFESGRKSRMKLVLVSRTVPRLLDSLDNRRTGRVEVLRLRGLDPQAALSLLRAKGLAAEDSVAGRIAASTRGHPMLLSLAARMGAEVDTETRKYFEEEIWNGLSPDEMVVLESACVYRRSVPLDALRLSEVASETALVGLEVKNLIEPTVGGGFVLHDAVRDYVRSRIPEERRKHFHDSAARYFMSRVDSRDRLEAIYHLLAAGQPSEAVALLRAQGPSFAESVGSAELAVLFEGVDPGSLDFVDACLVSEVNGDSLRDAGHATPAVRQYQHAIRASDRSGQQDNLPRLLRKIAVIERQRNEYPQALGHLVEAQAWLAKQPNSAELSEVLKEMALLEKIQGDFSSARAHLNTAIDVATEVSDAGALSRCLLVLGTLEAEQGNPQRGLEHKLESLRIAEKSGNVTESARASISVGASHWDLGNLEESLRYYEKGLSLARLAGNIRLISFAQMNCASVLVDLARYDPADVAIREARQLLEILEEPDSLAVLAMTEGQREMALGHPARAQRIWARAIQTLRRLGDPSDLARALLWAGGWALDSGDVQTGRGLLEEALEIARKTGNAAMVAGIQDQLAVIAGRLAGASHVGSGKRH